jgi:PH domain
MADLKNSQQDHYKGWLYKWTNYLKGYQKRWFVLQNGYLSYYRLVGAQCLLIYYMIVIQTFLR